MLRNILNVPISETEALQQSLNNAFQVKEVEVLRASRILVEARWAARPCQQDAQARIFLWTHTIAILWPVNPTDLENGITLSIAVVVGQVLQRADKHIAAHYIAPG